MRLIVIAAALLASLTGCASSKDSTNIVDWFDRVGRFSLPDAILELGPPSAERGLTCKNTHYHLVSWDCIETVRTSKSQTYRYGSDRLVLVFERDVLVDWILVDLRK